MELGILEHCLKGMSLRLDQQWYLWLEIKAVLVIDIQKNVKTIPSIFLILKF